MAAIHADLAKKTAEKYAELAQGDGQTVEISPGFLMFLQVLIEAFSGLLDGCLPEGDKPSAAYDAVSSPNLWQRVGFSLWLSRELDKVDDDGELSRRDRRRLRRAMLHTGETVTQDEAALLVGG